VHKLAWTVTKRTLLFGIIILFWDLSVGLFKIPDYLLPPPQAIASAVVQDRTILWMHFLETFQKWALGLSCSILIALVLSLVAFSRPSLERVVQRFLVISQAVPYLTVAPLLLLWFGLGALPKIILIILTCSFPIAQLTLSGLQSARAEYSVLATLLRFDLMMALRQLYLPAAVPSFLNGVKISVTYAFVSTVLAELIGSEAGLGVYLSRAQSAYRTDRVLAVVCLIVVFSLLCTWIVGLFSKRILFWEVRKHV